MTSALRSRQLKPVNSVQTEAVAFKKSRGSPRNVNFDPCTIPCTGTVSPRALASCDSEIPEAVPAASQIRVLPGLSVAMFARILPPKRETPRSVPTRPVRRAVRSITNESMAKPSSRLSEPMERRSSCQRVTPRTWGKRFSKNGARISTVPTDSNPLLPLLPEIFASWKATKENGCSRRSWSAKISKRSGKSLSRAIQSMGPAERGARPRTNNFACSMRSEERRCDFSARPKIPANLSPASMRVASNSR